MLVHLTYWRFISNIRNFKLRFYIRTGCTNPIAGSENSINKDLALDQLVTPTRAFSKYTAASTLLDISSNTSYIRDVA